MTSNNPSPQRGRKLRLRTIAERYDVSPRTILRWVDAGILPAPTVIHNHPFFDLEEVEAFERKRMSFREVIRGSRDKAEAS
jgi:predicted site-specific integrase-resolvase